MIHSFSFKRTGFGMMLSVACLLGYVLMGCQGKTGASGTPEDGAGEADSLAALPVLLPDTSYASAAVINYVVEVDDSTAMYTDNWTDPYEQVNGVYAFRKNQRRDASFGGRVKGEPREVEIAWEFETDYDSKETQFGTWGGGSGWTGQPLYMHWTTEQMAMFKQSSPGLPADFDAEEIYVSSLCGKGYFINYKTGKASREALDLGNVVKGTSSLDPELYNLYVGQGVPHGAVPFGCQVFDLKKHERTQFFDRDRKAWRGWGAYDSSPIVAGGFLFWPGENGGLYKYVREQGQLRKVSVLRYRVKGAAPGIESSLCVYHNYGFFGDNHGNIICVNLNTMRPVWHYANHDDTDATLVCGEEKDVPYLYTACEVDKQGKRGLCHIVKLNGLNGEKVWEQTIECQRLEMAKKTLDGGMYSTPLLGDGDCKGMLFTHITRNGASKAVGEFTAFSTADGRVLYTVPYGQFAWSSPVALYNEKNEMFVFAGDASGVVRVMRGKTGEVLCRLEVGANFESSPVVVGNTVVVGTRGRKIYKFVIK
ncbi:MAG: dehydrogenase [Bacteroidaceae bacterium]|nr:dehydrogenase [Bacteroidaceae bacterium]